ncbi:MAG: carboxypeptidase-like regulatory domain-containing protein, partial [Vicinamibacterales bacterium]
MTSQWRPGGFLLTVVLLATAFTGLLAAQLQSPSALAGKVTSAADGPMEGVLIGARKAGSTIATWVVTDAQGDYRFPRERMEPGKYTIRVRAVGYQLPETSVDVDAHGAHLDL